MSDLTLARPLADTPVMAALLAALIPVSTRPPERYDGESARRKVRSTQGSS
jgi:hypothetical protein